ncbi:MAG TPA: methyltransferase [Candidatus Faecousia intestinigallinarum]|nr:methyltransferase [Candidatus Faecousia intestinigallinarum]
MEYLHNGLTLELSPGAFLLSTDSMVLADFVRPRRGARVLDLGSGCGTLGLLLCASCPDCHVTGVELDAQAHRMALENARRNGITSRLESICADLSAIPTFLEHGSFHLCCSNPPYFSGGLESQTYPIARQERSCALPQLFAAAAWAVRYGGDFCLVHRPERLGELFAQADKTGFAPKRLRLVRHREGGPVTLVLVQCRRGGKHGLTWEEEALFTRQGEKTAYYRRVYHL